MRGLILGVHGAIQLARSQKQGDVTLTQWKRGLGQGQFTGRLKSLPQRAAEQGPRQLRLGEFHLLEALGWIAGRHGIVTGFDVALAHLLPGKLRSVYRLRALVGEDHDLLVLSTALGERQKRNVEEPLAEILRDIVPLGDVLRADEGKNATRP